MQLTTLLTIAFLAPIQQRPQVPLHFATTGTFSATPVCGADHVECHGHARLLLPTDYGPMEIASRDVRAGERFELSFLGAPLLQQQRDALVVELALEGHDPVISEALPLDAGCDLGPWRVPAFDPLSNRKRLVLAEVRPMGLRRARLELRGGSAGDAIVGFTIPDDVTGPRACGLAYHNIESPNYGVQRIDARHWLLDLERLNVDPHRYRIFVDTLSGAIVPAELDRSAFLEGEPPVFAAMAPERLFPVHGTIVDASGRPVAGASVRVCPLPACIENFVLTDGDGRFDLEGFAEGRVWINVNDAHWRSRSLTGFFAPTGSGASPVKVIVNRQRWIQVNPTQLELAPGSGALLSLEIGKDDERNHVGFIVDLRAEDLTAPFDIPAIWGDDFTVSVVPMPSEGQVHDGDLMDWIHDARTASARVSFAGAVGPGLTRYVAPKPD